MARGWAQEYVDEGIEKGILLTTREMLIEALDINFNKNVPSDIQQKIQALNNRILLKKLLKPAFQSKDIEGFRKSIEELTKEES